MFLDHKFYYFINFQCEIILLDEFKASFTSFTNRLYTVAALFMTLVSNLREE